MNTTTTGYTKNMTVPFGGSCFGGLGWVDLRSGAVGGGRDCRGEPIWGSFWRWGASGRGCGRGGAVPAVRALRCGSRLAGQRGWVMASRARAPGCCWGSRKRTRRPVWHTTAGRCHSCQRSRLGAARRRVPVRQRVWNHPTSARPVMHRAAQALLACHAVNGMRARPLSLSRQMAFSTSACERMRRSSWATSPVRSVRNPPVSVVVASEQAALRAGMQRFAAHYQPGSSGPARQVDEVGEVRDLSAAGLALAGPLGGVVPAARVAQSAADRCLDAGRRACGHHEPDVAGCQSRGEPGRASRRVDAHHQRTLRQLAVVAWAVPCRVGLGQHRHRGVDHFEMIGDVVRGGVARPQLDPQRLPVRGRAHHRMKPVAALEMRRCTLFVLRVDLHQCRVDVDHQRATTIVTGPQPGAHRCRCAHQRRTAAGAQTGHSAIQRRVRRHLAEQLTLSTQILDIGARLTAARQHQQRMNQNRAPVMNRGTLPAGRHRRRQRPGQPHSVREPPQSEQARTPHDPVPAACQLRVRDTGRFHLGDAPLNSKMLDSTPCIVAGQRGFSADPHHTNPQPHEESGLKREEPSLDTSEL